MERKPATTPSVLLIAPVGGGSREILRILTELQLSITHIVSYREALDLNPKDYVLVFWDVGEGTGPMALYQTMQEHFYGLCALFGYSLRSVARDRARALEYTLDWFFKDLLAMEAVFKRSVRAQVSISILTQEIRSAHTVDDLWFSLLLRLSK